MVATALMMASPSSAANLINNGGFDDGLTDWEADGWKARNYFPVGTYADTLCGSRYCTLSQTVSTIAGATYDLSISYNAGYRANDGAVLKIYFGDQLVSTLTGGSAPFDTFEFHDLVAASENTVLLFSGISTWGTLALDSIELVEIEAPAVPEPATWAMLIAGFGLIGATLRRRTPAAAAVIG